MAVFRVERNTGYTVMSNHHLRNKELTLKAKGFHAPADTFPCPAIFGIHRKSVLTVGMWWCA